MFRNKTKALLIIFLVIQFLMPLGLLLYKGNTQKTLDNTEANVRLRVESIGIDSEVITIIPEVNHDGIRYVNKKGVIKELDDTETYYGDYNFFVFEQGENGYSSYYISDLKPEHNAYILCSDIYNLYSIEIPVDYKYEAYEKFGDIYFHVYDKASEEENIEHGVCEGPATEAYVDLTIHNGNLVFKGANVGGYDLYEHLAKCDSGEIDIDRFEYNYFDTDFNLGDYYESLDEDTKELVDKAAESVLQ